MQIEIDYDLLVSKIIEAINKPLPEEAPGSIVLNTDGRPISYISIRQLALEQAISHVGQFGPIEVMKISKIYYDFLTGQDLKDDNADQKEST